MDRSFDILFLHRTTETFNLVLPRKGFLENWARFERPENPLAVALAVLNDPHGEDSVRAEGLPIVWRQRVGTFNGEQFRVIYTRCRSEERGLYAYVSYVAAT